MRGEPVLGILPTGTGKSVCYQIPALAKFQKTGALTVVISPLVALMADQVEGLRRHGVSACVAVNGLLSLPERHDVLDRVRMGDAAILLISPEQLRNPSVRAILKQREIGYWVIDEAHCLSKWGQDFRPDYRYISRFIREYSGDDPPAPLICLTATAKPSVLRDILDHFDGRLGVELQLINGGAFRDNLAFEVIETTRAQKNAEILSLLTAGLSERDTSGAIVYCATRSRTEDVAAFLQAQGLAADHFHAGLKPEKKKEVQEQFQRGELRVIAATNAFGMGIDKPDIRLVIHADIPGSLENYVQEAGRAGRDRKPARCVLLFCSDDIERQFKLSAHSRLSKREIAAILRALRRLDARTKRSGEVIATPGEIIKEELDREFERDTRDRRYPREDRGCLARGGSACEPGGEPGPGLPVLSEDPHPGRGQGDPRPRRHHPGLPLRPPEARRAPDPGEPRCRDQHRRSRRRLRPDRQSASQGARRSRASGDREQRHEDHRVPAPRRGERLEGPAGRGLRPGDGADRPAA